VLKDIKELPKAIKQSLQKTVNLSDLSDYVNWNKENGFEFLYEYYVRAVGTKFKSNVGFLKDIQINSEIIDSLLTDFADVYKKLGQEYIKKIKSFDN